MKNIIAVVIVCIILAGCTDPDRAQKVLEDNGYTNIHTGGYSMFGFGRGDTYATEFESKTPAGKPVNGVVCSAWLKGSTIRFFD